MREVLFIGLLTAEAILCLALRLLRTPLSGVFSAAMAFPFEQIGLGLRALSLSGAMGNSIAIVVYACVGLLPIAVLPLLRKKRGLRAEDWLLVLLSAVMFAVLYLMINSAMISSWVPASAGNAIGKAILGSMVYSVLCGYLILRALRLFSAGDSAQLFRYMSVMLGLLNVIFVYLAFGAGFGGLLGSFAALRTGNLGYEDQLGASYACLTVKHIVNVAPYIFCIAIIFSGLRLLRELRSDRYSSETVGAARSMSRLCIAALTAMVLSNIAFNLLQLLFAKWLRSVNSSVDIPVFSIAFTLSALLMTRFITENKRLKDDNDMFI